MTNDEIFKIEIQKRFDELMKAKAAIGEIRIWSNGIKYQKQANGSWEPLSKKGVKPEKEEGKFFGKNYFQFKNKPEEAIDFLLKEKRGQVIGALERKELGKIDIVYGNNNGGLCHIRNKHFVHADDFSSLDEMKDIIIDILKSGKIGEPYRDKRDNNLKRNITKGYHKVVVKHTLVYDDEDNFKEKVWVLTSYDVSRKQEDKIRKAVSEETALERDQVIFNPNNSSVSSRKNHLERDQPSVDYSQCSLSQPKDTSYSLNEQQFMDEIIEKAKKGSPIGTEKTWEGKLYIKTEKGWRPKSNAKKVKKEDDQTDKTSSKVNDITSYASKASDKQLQSAIKDESASPKVKAAAEKELKKRQGKLEDYKKKEETVNDESLYEAVLNYVAGDAYDINNPNIKSKEKEEFDKAFKKYSSNVSNEVGVLIRGLEDVGWENLLKFNNLEGKKIEDLKGTILENPGYLSTTKNSDFEDFDDFEPTYIIHFDKGELTDIKGIDVNKVLLKKDNFFKYQEEVILNKNLSMKIDKIEKKNGIVHLKTSFVNKETLDNFRLKQDIINEIDKKLSDMTGFKKITQTYVKKDGKTVVIKMKSDNQYKATSPGFKLESKPYESLIDFKKRIKEELDKQSIETEKKEEKQELSFAEGKEFETVKQFYK